MAKAKPGGGNDRMAHELRIGIDLGGTKIACLAFGDGDAVLFEDRVATPREDYAATLEAIAALVAQARAAAGGAPARVGIGMPGSVSPVSGRVQNANSTWLNGRDFASDIRGRLGLPVRLANDANCLALSEAADGAAAGAPTVFGVILGTGCGGALVIDGKVLAGANRIGGEWGHNPLPWAEPDEHPGPPCWCGRKGCLETWLSGPALARDHLAATGKELRGEAIAAAARAGDRAAQATLERHASRLARGLAHVVNLFDPDVIVLGGGLSGMAHLYEELPRLMPRWIFAEAPRVTVRPARHGPASGVRGAARLWDMAEDWIV